ncbi:MAG: hypothetical protein LBJ01_03745, partial [Tannerella sp.]|nr:hypothetical protein [Tannerella sp.]
MFTLPLREETVPPVNVIDRKMDTQETMLRADESGETPVMLPEETQSSEQIRPDEQANEVVEETDIQQTVIEQPETAPE